MVNTSTKSGNQKEEPLVRIPPKRNFSETLGGTQKILALDQQKDMKDTPRGGQRRIPNPSPARLDAKTMIKIVPTLSGRELKQLVNTIVRRRRREKGARNKRPSEPASERGTTAITSPPLAPPESSHTTTRPVPEDQVSSAIQVVTKTEEGPRRAEEPDLAVALLRQVSRQCFSSRYLSHTQAFETF